jgi:hypothetical protein
MSTISKASLIEMKRRWPFGTSALSDLIRGTELLSFGSSLSEPAPGLSGDPGDHPSADVSGARSNRANFIVRHWRGELSLPVSYWVNGWLVWIGYVVTVVVPVMGLKEVDETGLAFAITALFGGALGIALEVWRLVGVWRSAQKRAESGAGRFWARTAQAAVICGWLALFGGIVRALLPAGT